MIRSHWKGYISFGLVSIPVNLIPTVNKAADITFHQIDKRNHARIHYQRINEVTGKKVDWDNIIKGYEVDKETLVPVPDDIVDRVGGENSRTVSIETFIDKNQLDFITIDKSYFVVPEKKGEKGYFLLLEALRKSKKIGISKVVLTTREYVAALVPHDVDAFVLYLLRYDSEMRKISDLKIPAKSSVSAKITKKEISVASQLINSMTDEHWNPASFTDSYQKSLHKWAKAVVNGKPEKQIHKKMVRKSSNVIDFVDLLKKSIGNTKTTSHFQAPKKKSKKRKAKAS